jgi:hypothetical protein
MVADARRDAARKGLEKAARSKDADPAELQRLAAEATAKGEQEKGPPTCRRYMTNDTTVEKLGELLGENPNGLLIYRDELPGFLRTLDKRGHESDRAFYLESWNGTGSFDYDRIGRGNVHIEAVCLSILGGIQPGPLASYLRSAVAGQGDDGLISRFQLAVYPDQERPFRIVDRVPNIKARDRALAVFRALDRLTPEMIGAKRDDFGSIPFLRFGDDAQEFFYGWLSGLEAKLRGDEPPAIESHLAKYRSLMPSLALHCHVVEVLGGAPAGPVSLLPGRRAAAWCDVMEEHARRIYQAATDGDMQPARTLAGRMTKGLPGPFTTRDVQKKGWSGLTDTDEIERALGVLEEHGWVRGVEYPSGERGGRPTVKYHINPAVRAEVPPP